MEIKCEQTLAVIRALQAAKIDCYIVGGYVRDSLLGLEPYDLDIELHNTNLKQALEVITSVAPAKVIGNFGVISLLEAGTEFALARTESKVGMKHNQFEVEFITDGDLNLAANRRDFTINSIMYDLQTNQIIDLVGGVEDLNNRVIRHVSSAFSEDPLRSLRGFRFASTLGFTIAPETLELCNSLGSEICHLSLSRIETETLKMVKGHYFADVAKQYIEFLSIVLGCESIPPVVRFGIEPTVNCLAIVSCFVDYQLVLNNLFEQKKIKKDIKFILSNLSKVVGFEQLSANDKYDLIANGQYVTEMLVAINPDLNLALIKYAELSKVYNGRYFLDQGISGKAIKTAIAEAVGGEL